jgi:alpha-tubulin suppressor-like RCC1 family protein
MWYSWGSGGSGVLGHGVSDRDLPLIASYDNTDDNTDNDTKVNNTNDAVAARDATTLPVAALSIVACGGLHAIGVVDNQQELYWWGEIDDTKSNCSSIVFSESQRHIPKPVVLPCCSCQDQEPVPELELDTDAARDNKTCGVKYLTCGWNHACAITLCCDALFELSRVAPLHAVRRLGGTRIQSVSCGWKHILCVTTERKVYGWGSNNKGQLGLPSLQNTKVPSDGKRQKCGRKRTAEVEVYEPTQVNVPLGFVPTSVCCGWEFSVLHDAKSGVLCSSGSNKYGQLGLALEGGTRSRVFNMTRVHVQRVLSHSSDQQQQLQQQQQNTAAVANDDDHGIDDDEEFISMYSCGWSHVITASSNRKHVYIWGRGDLGQLGTKLHTSANKYRNRPDHLPLAMPCTIASVHAGSEHSCCVTTSGELYMWGWNEHGNLGQGDKINRFEPTLVTAFPSHCRVQNVTTGGASILVKLQQQQQ